MPGAHAVVDTREQLAGRGDLSEVVAPVDATRTRVQHVEELLGPKLANTPDLDPPSSPKPISASTPATHRRTAKGTGRGAPGRWPTWMRRTRPSAVTLIAPSQRRRVRAVGTSAGMSGRVSGTWCQPIFSRDTHPRPYVKTRRCGVPSINRFRQMRRSAPGRACGTLADERCARAVRGDGHTRS